MDDVRCPECDRHWTHGHDKACSHYRTREQKLEAALEAKGAEIKRLTARNEGLIDQLTPMAQEVERLKTIVNERGDAIKEAVGEIAKLCTALRETREAFLICYAAVRDHADGECPCANILTKYADLAGEADHA